MEYGPTIPSNGDLAELDLELQVFRLKQDGHSLTQIAQKLGISYGKTNQTFKRALGRHMAERDELRARQRDYQYSRLERFISGVAPMAVAGDLEALDRAIKLIDMELKLDGLYSTNVGVKGAIDHNVVHTVSQQLADAFAASDTDRELAQILSGQLVEGDVEEGEVVEVEVEVNTDGGPAPTEPPPAD